MRSNETIRSLALDFCIPSEPFLAYILFTYQFYVSLFFLFFVYVCFDFISLLVFILLFLYLINLRSLSPQYFNEPNEHNEFLSINAAIPCLPINISTWYARGRRGEEEKDRRVKGRITAGNGIFILLFYLVSTRAYQ